MQWDGEINGDDIVSDIGFWTGADETVAYPLADRSRNSNKALDICNALILTADGYKYDDSNNTSTTLLDVTTNLANGTDKYARSLTWLKMGRVRIKDPNGNWVTLTPTERRSLTDAQLAASGTPDTYHVLGNWIYPRPIPNYASSGGLELQFQRGASYFVPTDTTKTPGFATQFHRLISLYASLDYCDVNDLDKRAKKIRERIAYMEPRMVEFYSQRDTDAKVSLSIQREDYGESAL